MCSCLVLQNHVIIYVLDRNIRKALMKEISDTDNLAIAWKYPGQALEVIPARYSRMTRPTTWPANCAVNSDCDDGIWCNGALSLFWTLSSFVVHAGIYSFALMNINLT